jgi:endonuclease III
MNQTAIRDRLVEHGKNEQADPFTEDPKADALLKDLDKYPHAFVLACVMDRQTKAEKAWIIPHRFRCSQALQGDFSMNRLKQLSLPEVRNIMSPPKPAQSLHRLVEQMSKAFHSAIQRISNQYADDASRIWKGEPSSAEVYRFLEFDGVGPKIATMAANILARDFKIQFADHYSIDISADRHIHRVFARLGLTAADASVEQVIYKARTLHPEYPGIIDLPCWKIGRNWCKPDEDDLMCNECYMRDLCLTAALRPAPSGAKSL